MAGSFYQWIFLSVTALAAGSWALYILVVIVGDMVNELYIEFRIPIIAFSMLAWGLHVFMAFNVAVPDGSGGLIVTAYPFYGYFGLAGAFGSLVFLVDSVMKAFKVATEGEFTEGGLQTR